MAVRRQNARRWSDCGGLDYGDSAEGCTGKSGVGLWGDEGGRDGGRGVDPSSRLWRRRREAEEVTESEGVRGESGEGVLPA